METDGTYTDAGREARAVVERETDALSAVPVRNLGPERAARLTELNRTICDHLARSGASAGVWPPPGVMKPDA